MSELSQSRSRIERQRMQILTLFDQKIETSKNKTRAIKQVSEILGVSTRQIFRILKNNERNGKDE